MAVTEPPNRRDYALTAAQVKQAYDAPGGHQVPEISFTKWTEGVPYFKSRGVHAPDEILEAAK